MSNNNQQQQSSIVLTKNNNHLLPRQRKRFEYEILREVLDLFNIKEKVGITYIRYSSNYVASCRFVVSLLANGLIIKNPNNNLRRQTKTAYPTFSITTKGNQLLYKLDLLDRILPFEELRRIRYQ